MNTVGERIKETRLAQGLSQAGLALAADVSQPTVANWENNSHIPRQHALNRLAGILRKPAHWFIAGDNGANGYGLAPQHYLKTPIQHVPILAWPTIDDNFGNELPIVPVHDYLAISTDAATPFALIANDPAMAAHFPIGAAIIFDSDAGELEEGHCYLFSKDNEIILRRWQNAPNRMEALPNQSAVDADFVSKAPKPLAKALLSVRRH